MERAAAADRAEAERRALAAERERMTAKAPEAPRTPTRRGGAPGELAAERERMTAKAPEAPEDEPEAVAPELPAAAADETDAADEFARIDCDSPRVDLGGESELSARIDALFRVKRSRARGAAEQGCPSTTNGCGDTT